MPMGPSSCTDPSQDAQGTKSRRTGSKVWSELRGAIRAFGRSSSYESTGYDHGILGASNSVDGLLLDKSPSFSEFSSSANKVKAMIPTELAKKLRLDSLVFAPNTTVIQRHPKLRSKRSSLQAWGPVRCALSSDTYDSAQARRLPKSTPEVNSTRLSTDTQCSSQPSVKENLQRRISRKLSRGNPNLEMLETINEAISDEPVASIVSAEKAAAIRVYFETYFNELVNQPTSRDCRVRQLENHLYFSPQLNPQEKSLIRWSFAYQESCYLREMRVLKAQSQIRHMGEPSRYSDEKYEQLKILGQGSFGVVRLVRERSKDSYHPLANQVFAMKIIRKSEMLLSSQEGHLRAERDFLVASKGANWIVPLVSSFQDHTSLYLVMEYMPGGDFLGLLIREQILPEAVARFYIAEMILAVEETHRYNFIHRDIKPDNFLISASGHLKISDFGLAFDGHWSHDASFFNWHRYSLVRKLGIQVDGDKKDQEACGSVKGRFEKLRSLTVGADRHDMKDADQDEYLSSIVDWRNQYGNRIAANSVVGTSQYMAPEVIRGQGYDGRCDWWSIGIILYECIYGHTPFIGEREQGRKETKERILAHNQTFQFPMRPIATDKCRELMYHLIRDKKHRLSSKLYAMKDLEEQGVGITTNLLRHHVFPHDGEDIRAHKWFKQMPWDHMHTLKPPFIPHVTSFDDTQYFNESEPIEDWSDSSPSAGLTVDEVKSVLEGFRPAVQSIGVHLVAAPHDSTTLRKLDEHIEAQTDLTPDEKNILKQFMRLYGRKQRKRPRDLLLRDDKFKKIVMDTRKASAFIGYTWKRMRPGGYLAHSYVH